MLVVKSDPLVLVGSHGADERFAGGEGGLRLSKSLPSERSVRHLSSTFAVTLNNPCWAVPSCLVVCAVRVLPIGRSASAILSLLVGALSVACELPAV